MSALPFLKPKASSVAGIIISHRKPDDESQAAPEPGDDTAALEACAEDLLRALASKDAKMVADALKSAYEICDSMPHEDPEQVQPSGDEE